MANTSKVAGALSRVYESAGAPTSGTSGTYAGEALPGAILSDTTNGVVYVNTNTQASPTWSKVGGLSGQASATASTFTPGAEAGNAIAVACQLKDANGVNLTQAAQIRVWLADASTAPFTVAAAAPDGGGAVTVGAAIEAVADKVFNVTTNATGAFTLTVTESTAKTFYLIAAFPDGKVAKVADLAFA